MKLAGVGRIAVRAGPRATTIVFAHGTGPPTLPLQVDFPRLGALANGTLSGLPHLGVCGEVVLHVMLPVTMLGFTPSRRPHVENTQRGIRAFTLAFGNGAPFGHGFGECNERGFGHPER